MYVYRIWNRYTKKSYVGQTSLSVASRWRSHCRTALKRPTSRIDLAIRLYGPSAFEVTTLCECGSNEELNSKEVEFIKSLKTSFPKGYNTSVKPRKVSKTNVY